MDNGQDEMMTESVEGHLSAMQVFGYYASGSETESTLRDNRAVFSRYRLMPRMMVDVSNVDTTLTLLGEMPIDACHAHLLLSQAPCLACCNEPCKLWMRRPFQPFKIRLTQLLRYLPEGPDILALMGLLGAHA